MASEKSAKYKQEIQQLRLENEVIEMDYHDSKFNANYVLGVENSTHNQSARRTHQAHQQLQEALDQVAPGSVGSGRITSIDRQNYTQSQRPSHPSISEGQLRAALESFTQQLATILPQMNSQTVYRLAEDAVRNSLRNRWVSRTEAIEQAINSYRTNRQNALSTPEPAMLPDNRQNFLPGLQPPKFSSNNLGSQTAIQQTLVTRGAHTSLSGYLGMDQEPSFGTSNANTASRSTETAEVLFLRTTGWPLTFRLHPSYLAADGKHWPSITVEANRLYRALLSCYHSPKTPTQAEMTKQIAVFQDSTYGSVFLCADGYFGPCQMASDGTLHSISLEETGAMANRRETRFQRTPTLRFIANAAQSPASFPKRRSRQVPRKRSSSAGSTRQGDESTLEPDLQITYNVPREIIAKPIAIGVSLLGLEASHGEHLDYLEETVEEFRDRFEQLLTYYVVRTQMMFVSGETAEPSTETTGLIEEIVREQVIEMLKRATELANRRGVKSIATHDLIFLIRHDKAKVSRLKTFLSWKDVRKNVKDSDDKGGGDAGDVADFDEAPGGVGPTDTKKSTNKKAKLILPWEVQSFYSEQVPERDDEEDNEEEEEQNEATLARLASADERTKNMTREEYVFWSECRQASFTFRKGKRFREWAGFGVVTDSKPNDDIVDILGFLTFEIVQTLTEEALKVKAAEDLHQANQRGGAAESKKRKRAGEGGGLFEMPEEGRTPIEPKHVREGFRRLQVVPTKYLFMRQGYAGVRTPLRLF